MMKAALRRIATAATEAVGAADVLCLGAKVRDGCAMADLIAAHGCSGATSLCPSRSECHGGGHQQHLPSDDPTEINNAGTAPNSKPSNLSNSRRNSSSDSPSHSGTSAEDNDKSREYTMQLAMQALLPRRHNARLTYKHFAVTPEWEGPYMPMEQPSGPYVKLAVYWKDQYPKREQDGYVTVNQKFRNFVVQLRQALDVCKDRRCTMFEAEWESVGFVKPSDKIEDERLFKLVFLVELDIDKTAFEMFQKILQRLDYNEDCWELREVEHLPVLSEESELFKCSDEVHTIVAQDLEASANEAKHYEELDTVIRRELPKRHNACFTYRNNEDMHERYIELIIDWEDECHKQEEGASDAVASRFQNFLLSLAKVFYLYKDPSTANFRPIRLFYMGDKFGDEQIVKLKLRIYMRVKKSTFDLLRGTLRRLNYHGDCWRFTEVERVPSPGIENKCRQADFSEVASALREVVAKHLGVSTAVVNDDCNKDVVGSRKKAPTMAIQTNGSLTNCGRGGRGTACSCGRFTGSLSNRQ